MDFCFWEDEREVLFPILPTKESLVQLKTLGIVCKTNIGRP